MMFTNRFWSTGDGLGILNSALCLVHCLAMPVFIAVGASFMQHPSVTWGFIALAFLAVRSAVRSRNNPMMAMLLGIGWGVFAAGMALEGVHPLMESLTYVGSALLILGHVLNWMDFRAVMPGYNEPNNTRTPETTNT
jgi:hypothetical protein